MAVHNANVEITKLAVAQRQLHAAIHMTFLGIDPLAITVVASAAYNVLRDIKKWRGHRVLEDEWETAVLGTARALVRGDLSSQETSLFQNSALWEVIEQTAELIKVHGPEKTISELRPIVRVSISRETEKRLWSKPNKTASFLKHANKDPEASLNLDDVNDQQLILGSCDLHFDLMAYVSPEMQLWLAHEMLKRGHSLNDLGPIETFGRALDEIDPKNRNKACLDLFSAISNRQKRLDQHLPPSGPLSPSD